MNDSTHLDRASMMKFVENYREAKLAKVLKASKPNVFSLKSSLSEKCLMQKCYSKVFDDKPEKNKPKNYELFTGLKQKQAQKSI